MYFKIFVSVGILYLPVCIYREREEGQRAHSTNKYDHVEINYLNLPRLDFLTGAGIDNRVLSISSFHEKRTFPGLVDPILAQISINKPAKHHHQCVDPAEWNILE